MPPKPKGLEQFITTGETGGITHDHRCNRWYPPLITGETSSPSTLPHNSQLQTEVYKNTRRPDLPYRYW